MQIITLTTAIIIIIFGGGLVLKQTIVALVFRGTGFNREIGFDVK